jgi:hypothetical protein
MARLTLLLKSGDRESFIVISELAQMRSGTVLRRMRKSRSTGMGELNGNRAAVRGQCNSSVGRLWWVRCLNQCSSAEELDVGEVFVSTTSVRNE